MICRPESQISLRMVRVQEEPQRIQLDRCIRYDSTGCPGKKKQKVVKSQLEALPVGNRMLVGESRVCAFSSDTEQDIGTAMVDKLLASPEHAPHLKTQDYFVTWLSVYDADT